VKPSGNLIREHCLILAGSNLGDRKAHITGAISALKSLHGIEIIQTSRFYETEPVGMPEGAGWFLNCAISLDSRISPEGLLRELLAMERKLGRARNKNRNLRESRTIDLDILLFGDRVVDTPKLKIPHPEMSHRRFVLVPSAEIEPDMLHPVLKKSVKEMLEELKDGNEVRLFSS
jgi:2-amino-4-hydroxy-6-hydroxymethyldihydropteridine diphosphokinase